MSLQECQQSTTSTEFVEWLIYFRQVEWHETTRLDYYLAQIAAEVRTFRNVYSSKFPKMVDPEECLIKFTGSTLKPEDNIVEYATPITSEVKPIEVGSPEVLTDPHWSRVNRQMKQVWAARLGVASLEELGNG